MKNNHFRHLLALYGIDFHSTEDDRHTTMDVQYSVSESLFFVKFKCASCMCFPKEYVKYYQVVLLDMERRYFVAYNVASVALVAS